MTGTAPSPTADTLRQRFVGGLVVVEPLASEHEQGLIEAASERELFRWMPVDMASSPDAVRRWLQAALEGAGAGREVPFAILDAESQRVLGSTRFLELRFEHRRVEFKTDARNQRSRGALLALGAQFEGILRKHMVVRDGGARDSAYYSVTDDDWPALKPRLQDRRDEHLARRGRGG